MSEGLTVSRSHVQPTAAAPRGGWRLAVRDGLMVGGATAVGHALGAVTALVLRLLLDPAQMGIWQALKLALSYGNYANLGASKAAARELSIAGGKDQPAAAAGSVNQAFTFGMVTSGLYAVVLVVAGVWIAATGAGKWSTAWAVGLGAVAALALLQRYASFQVTMLRAQRRFGIAARLNVIEAAVTLVACGLATWLFGLPGLYLGTAAVMACAVWYLHRCGAWPVQWAWHGGELRRLIVIGGPILLAGTAGSLLRSIDKLMILGYLPDREYQLGAYSAALMVTAQLYGMANMLAIVMGPRYAELLGETGDRRAVARVAALASGPTVAVVAWLAAVSVTAGGPLLGFLLPDYRAGLAVLVWLVPGSVALTVALAPSQYLVAVGRQNTALAAVLVAIVVALAGNHVALAGGWGIAGVAVATTISYILYAVLVVAVSLWIELTRRERAVYVGTLAVVAAPCVAVGMAFALRGDGSPSPAEVALATVAVSVVWAASAAIAWSWSPWRTAWNKESA